MLKSNQLLGPKPVPAELHSLLAEDQLLQTAHEIMTGTITWMDDQ